MRLRFREIFPRFTEELKRLRHLERLADVRPPIPSRRVRLFMYTIIADILVVWWLFENTALEREAVFMSGIFVLAALLWVTEALPLFATAILIIALEIIFLANPGEWAGFGFGSGY